jgi:nitroimidazol reductase NimA-like FMN-containing flavoprotein (pyridoxamine 5'-phosphate oxidase superfamily)
MFKEMRRKDKQLTQEEAIEVLKDAKYGVLSTVCPDGYPYGVILNFVYSEGSVYFHSARQGQKLDNIENDSRVSFCSAANVTLLPKTFDTNYRSVCLFGKASEVFGREKEDALKALIKKYAAAYLEAGMEYVRKSACAARVFRIEIDHLTGKAQQ